MTPDNDAMRALDIFYKGLCEINKDIRHYTFSDTDFETIRAAIQRGDKTWLDKKAAMADAAMVCKLTDEIKSLKAQIDVLGKALVNLINEHESVLRGISRYEDGDKILTGIADELTPAKQAIQQFNEPKGE